MILQGIETSVPGLIIGALTTLFGGVLGAAYGPLGREPDGFTREIELDQAILDAQAKTNWRLWQRIRGMFVGPHPRQRSSDGSSGQIVIFIVVVAFITQQYMRFTTLVVFTLLMLTLLMLGATFLTFVVLGWRHVIAARSVTRRLIGTVLLSSISIFSAFQLISPMFQLEALTEIREFLTTNSGIVSVLIAPKIPVVLFQLVGAMITFVALITSIALCIASLTAVYIHLGTTGTWLWRTLFWINRFSVVRGVFWTTFISAVVAASLTSGALFEVIAGISLQIPINAPPD